MISRKPLTLLLIIIVTCCSSCFQLIEEITLNNDGSGEMQITLNMSQSRSKLASIMLLDSVNGHKIPSRKDISHFMDETVAFLQKSEGISNIRKSVDLENYIAAVSFNFKDLARINGITGRLLKRQDIKGPDNDYSFEKNTGIFKRTFHYSGKMQEAFDKLDKKDKEIFKTAVYVNICRFPKPVLSSSNTQSRLSPSGKAVMLTTPALELIAGTASISNNIRLSR